MLDPRWRGIAPIATASESGPLVDPARTVHMRSRHAFLCGFAWTNPVMRVRTIAYYRRICASTAEVGQQSSVRRFAFW